MRTTLSIDDDVLAAARKLASLQMKSVGQVISELSRQTLRTTFPNGITRNGVPLLMRRPDASPINVEIVNRLRDELVD